MKVLVYNGKHEVEVIDATIKLNALIYLFTLLDKYGYYKESEMDTIEKIWYDRIKNNHCMYALEQFMNRRKSYEYESWTIVRVKNEKDYKQLTRKETNER